jgi:tRNA threonylcarbamoyladenosine biosynthesis protein TsaE
MPEIVLPNINAINKFVNEFFEIVKEHKIIAFKGEMGAGKTTLIKALCIKLELEDVVTSPSFSIVNEYHSKKFGKIFHFDFYRIDNETEINDIGFEEYMSENAIIFMEWPEKIPNLLPEDVLIVKIKINHDYSRTIIW